MNDLMLFLFEASTILCMLYLIYYALLRKEASFNFNRFYLLGAVVIASTLPFLEWNIYTDKSSVMNRSISQLSDIRLDYQQTIEDWSLGIFDQNEFEISPNVTYKEKKGHWSVQLIFIVYIVGFVLVIARFIWMISWIFKLQSRHSKEYNNGLNLVKVPYQIAPFSFLKWVFVPQKMIKSDELAHILEHERTHISQKHSYDLLIVQLLSAVLWFNPVVWWLSKSLKTTHEYIADRNMIKQGYSLVEYQTLLLRQLISNNSFGLVHNFNLSFIKKRIIMMNIQKLGGLGKFKVVAVITMTILFSLIIVQCNSEKLVVSTQSMDDLPLIESVGFGFEANDGVLEIELEENQMRVNGVEAELADLKEMTKPFDAKRMGIALRAASNLPMKKVYELQEALRMLDLRKIIYLGRTNEGTLEEVVFLLAPHPNSDLGLKIPVLTEEFIKEHDLDLFRYQVSQQDRIDSEVVQGQVTQHLDDMNYVFELKYKDDDTYQKYLSNLQSLKQGFYDIYEERAQELYGKSFAEIAKKRPYDEVAKQQYAEVRKGIPMSISVAKM